MANTSNDGGTGNGTGNEGNGICEKCQFCGGDHGGIKVKDMGEGRTMRLCGSCRALGEAYERAPAPEPSLDDESALPPNMIDEEPQRYTLDEWRATIQDALHEAASLRLAETTAYDIRVGDRVQFDLDGKRVYGTVLGPDPTSRAHVQAVDGATGYTVRRDRLTVIERAPAPEPAQPAPMVASLREMQALAPAALGAAWRRWEEACRWDNVQPMVALLTLIGRAATRGANAAVDMLAPTTRTEWDADPADWKLHRIRRS